MEHTYARFMTTARMIPSPGVAPAVRRPDRKLIFIHGSEAWERDRKRLVDQLARYGFTRPDRMCISVALDEAVTFATRWRDDHPGPRPDVMMAYSLSADEFRARVRLVSPSPQPPEGNDRWALALSCMTGMRVSSDGTEVEMWKSRTATAPSRRIVPRVLLAQKDDELLALLASGLRDAGFDVVTCTDGRNFVNHVAYYITPEDYEKEEFDLIVSDARLPGANGLDVFKGLDREGFPPVIVIVGSDSPHLEWESRRHGAAAVFEWPCDVREIINTARRILAVEA